MGYGASEIPILNYMKRRFLTTNHLGSVVVFLFIFQLGDLSQAFSQQKEEPEQTVAEFNLSGFSQEVGKSWEISARSADIFHDEIILEDFTGTLYGQEKIIVTAEKGNFNKTQNKVHLEDNVVVATESGARLTTDYLDWDRDASRVETAAPVDIKKDDIVVSGVGIRGNAELSRVDLEKDVRVQIDNQKNNIVITCAGPLSINYADNVAVFKKDVSVNDGQTQMHADLMEVFFDLSGSNDLTDSITSKMSRIRKIVAKGNVRIERDGNVSFSKEAVYNAADRTLVLTGRPKLIIHSVGGKDASTGDKRAF